MAEAAVKCPHCQSEAVVKYGKTSTGSAFSVSAARAVWPDVCGQLWLAWLVTHREAAGRGHSAQWERHP